MSRTRSRALDAEAVIRSLRSWAQQVGKDPNVVKIVLFGSLARGDHTGSSDADLLIIVARSGACR